MMTNQEVFDKVAIHLLTQNKKSIHPKSSGNIGTCLYRGPDGLKCAVGAMIPDELYSPTFEGLTISDLAALDSSENTTTRNRAIKLMEYFRKEHISIALLRSLQSVHDRYSPVDWPYELSREAKMYELHDRIIHEHEKKALHGA
jgi:hypothetical protein